MNRQDIIDRFERLEPSPLTGSASRLDCVLQALFGEYLLPGTEDPSNLLDLDRVALYEVFNVSIDFEASCMMFVLAYDKKPIGVAFRSGSSEDWGSWVLDTSRFKVLARHLAAAVLEKRLSGVESEDEQELAALDHHSALYFLGSKESMFCVRSPEQAGGFRNMISAKRRCFYVDPEGTPQEVSRIGQFEHDKPGYQGPPLDTAIDVEVAGKALSVDATQLMFEVLPGADLKDAIEPFNRTPGWVVLEVYPKTSCASLLAVRKGQWSTKDVLAVFESPEELSQFAAKYFPEGRETFIEGEFDPERLGLKARVVT